MKQNSLKKVMQAFGPDTDVSYVRWAPSGSATQTLTEKQGVTSVTRSGAGAYVVNLKQKGGALFPLVGYVENDTTNFHFVEVTGMSPTAGTVNMRHRTVAYAGVASAPTASDSVDELVALIFQPKGTAVRAGRKGKLKAFGPKHEFAYVRFTPSGSATQTLTEAMGVTSVTRSGAGAWSVQLSSGCEAMVALISYVENDTTLYHFAEVTATSASAGTVTARHRAVAYASIGSGPSASDTVDEIEILVLKRMAT